MNKRQRKKYEKKKAVYKMLREFSAALKNVVVAAQACATKRQTADSGLEKIEWVKPRAPDPTIKEFQDYLVRTITLGMTLPPKMLRMPATYNEAMDNLKGE